MYEEDTLEVPKAAKAAGAPFLVTVHVNCMRHPVSLAVPGLAVLAQLALFQPSSRVRHVVVHTLEPDCRERYAGKIAYLGRRTQREGIPWLSFTASSTTKSTIGYNVWSGEYDGEEEVASHVDEAVATHADEKEEGPLHDEEPLVSHDAEEDVIVAATSRSGKAPHGPPRRADIINNDVYGETSTIWTEDSVLSMARETNAHGAVRSARHIRVSSPPKYLVGDGLDAGVVFGAIIANTTLRAASLAFRAGARPFVWFLTYVCCCCCCCCGLGRAIRAWWANGTYHALEDDAVHGVRWSPGATEIETFMLSVGGSAKVPWAATHFVRNAGEEDARRVRNVLASRAPTSAAPTPAHLLRDGVAPEALRQVYSEVEAQDGTYNAIKGMTSRRWVGSLAWALLLVVAWMAVVWWLDVVHRYMVRTVIPRMVEEWYDGIGRWAKEQGLTLEEARENLAYSAAAPYILTQLTYGIIMAFALGAGPFFYWPIYSFWVDFGSVRTRDGKVFFRNWSRVWHWFYLVFPSVGLAAYMVAILHCWLGRWAVAAALAGLAGWTAYLAVDGMAPVTVLQIAGILAFCANQLRRKWHVV